MGFPLKKSSAMEKQADTRMYGCVVLLESVVCLLWLELMFVGGLHMT